MLKKRFSTTLLALAVAAAIPGSAFAANVASESTGEVNAPASVSTPANNSNEDSNSGNVDTDTSGGTESGGAGEAQNPVGANSVADEQQSEDSDQSVDVVLPKEDSEGEQAPEVVEPDPQGDGEETTPEVTEPEIGDGTGTVDGGQTVEPEVPAVEVAEPEIALEEILPVVEEELVTEAAIIIEEPVAATLTITHRLIVGDKYADETQTIDGLEVGQEIDLTQYFAPVDWAECIAQGVSINLDSAEVIIVLEYVVKSDVDVNVTIEDGGAVVDQDINEELQPEQYYESGQTVK